MRRYTVHINDTDYSLDVEELSADTFAVHLGDGRLIDVRLTGQQDAAQATIAPQLASGHPTAGEAPAVANQTPGAPASAQAAPLTPPAVVAPAAPSMSSSTSAHGGATMIAPMPGTILSVDVKPGDKVQRGQTLIVLEAMKMNNELKAERAATIGAVLVKTGDQVKHGDVLIEFEG